nr:DUF1772 domain-containing protein [Janibacter anophelis]
MLDRLGRANGGGGHGEHPSTDAEVSTVISGAMVLRSRHDDDGAATWAAALGGVLLMVSVVMSLALLVPINNRGKTWTPRTAPSDWREQVQRWDRLHQVRVAVITVGFACVAFGVAVPG